MQGAADGSCVTHRKRVGLWADGVEGEGFEAQPLRDLPHFRARGACGC